MSSNESTGIKERERERTRIVDSEEGLRFKIERVFNDDDKIYFAIGNQTTNHAINFIPYPTFLSFSLSGVFFFCFCSFSLSSLFAFYLHFFAIFPLVAFLPQQDNDCHFRAAQ